MAVRSFLMLMALDDILVLLAHLLDLGLDHGLAVLVVGVLDVVVDVVLFGRIDGARWLHLCHHLLWQFGVHLVDDLLRQRLLVDVVVEDCRPVLRADVGPLSVELSGVVDEEEDVEDLLGANDVRVVLDLNDFGVAGVAFFHFLIGRLMLVAATVARNNLVDS